MKCRPLAAATLLAALLPVSAGAEGAAPFPLPPLGTLQPATAVAGPVPSAAATAVAHAGSWRRPAVTGDLLTFSGEHAVRRLPIFLTAAEAGRATELRVAAVTAIDVLETASSIEVYLNGALIDTLRPRFDGPARLVTRLEPGQVVAGVNELMIVARHEHRIDCSIPGTYQLWTRVLPEETGIIVPEAPTSAVALAELPAILGSTADPSALALELPSPLDDGEATRLVRLLDAVVLNGWMPRPRVELAAGAGTGRAPLGLRLASAPDASLVPFSDVEGLFLDLSADGTPAALVLAGSAVEMDAALAALEAAAARRMPAGSSRGIAALLSLYGTTLADSTAYSFAALAFDDLTFAGRHARVDLATVLPPDFFQADYGDLRLFLDGGAQGGLADGSRLKVKVNDVETVDMPLDGTRPTMFRQKEIRIPLDMFHAGLNTITIEAELLTGADVTCAPEAAPVTTPRFELRASSRLVTPRFARVGVTPNLSATFGHAWPHGIGTNAPTRVFIVGERTEALASAAAFLARMTANAQRPFPVEIALRRPTQAEHGIVVGPVAAMPDWMRPLLGTPEAAVAAIPAAATPATSEPASEMASLDLVRQRFSADPVSAPGADDGGLAALLGAAEDGATRVQNAIGTAATKVVGAVRGASGGPGERAYTGAEVVLTQAVAASDGGFDAVTAAVLPVAPPRTWTIVATPDAATLGRALAGPSETGVRFVPRGAHYVYDGLRDRVVTPGSDATLFATQTPGVFNLRLVAAGWLSHNPGIYVAVVVAAVVTAGLFLLAAVGRRRSGHGR